MRLVLVLVVALAGCFRGSLDSNMRPAVIPKLSELPGDQQRADAVLDSANVTSSPEQGSSTQTQTKQAKAERRATGFAAFAAAIVGSYYSTTENVTLGGATTFDENNAVAPTRPTATSEHDGDATETPPASDQPPSGTLLPWVKLKK